ncbi:TPA: hypothetical protein ACQ0F8_001620 [Streptococcus agalactiae]|nr:hypothetical protein [Streptococcus agalactiae]HEO4177352.1 hypothetical protein [Streptococcus agalactiae]
MVSYRLKRYKRDNNEENYTYNEDSNFYSDMDYENLLSNSSLKGSEVKQSSNFFKRSFDITKSYYDSKKDEARDHYRANVEIQKAYYSDRSSHWLRTQQNKRDREFLRKLVITMLILCLLMSLYFLSRYM